MFTASFNRCLRPISVALLTVGLFACGGEEVDSGQASSSSSSSSSSGGNVEQPGASADILSRGKQAYVAQCDVCHGATGKGVQGLGTEIFDWSAKPLALVDKILISMPPGAVNSCDLECSKLTAAYILAGFDENGTLHPGLSFEERREVDSTLQAVPALPDSTQAKVYDSRLNFDLPAVIEAENFDTGGEGVSFRETTTQKNGDAARRPETGVDIQDKLGRVSIGWFPPGEWVEHSFYLDKQSALKLNWVVATNQSQGGFEWFINGASQGEQRYQARSDWDLYVETESNTPLLAKGWHTLRMAPTVQMNFDRVTLSLADHQPVDDADLAFELPATIIHRLTNYEYLQTVNNLFGGDFSAVTAEFLSDPTTDGFVKISEGLVLDKRRLEQYYDAAVKIAEQVMADNTMASRVMSCNLSASTLNTCGAELVDKWGLRITRHPVKAQDRARYLALLESNLSSSANAKEAVEAWLSHMLFSAAFLHHIEVAPAENPISPIYTLSPYELANRLSYFLWCSAPDDALFALAESGEIQQTQVLSAEIGRMLSDEKSQCLADAVADQWLNLKKAKSVTVNIEEGAYEGWDPVFAEDMIEETKNFLMHLFRENRPIKELVNADYTFMSARLAAYYGLGMPDPTTGKVNLPSSSNRKGLLTQGSILTLTRSGHETFIHRGILILDKLLCSAPPPPPDDLVIEGSTEQDSCQGCHKFINPPGVALNQFDEVGRFEPIDKDGNAISAEGSFFMGPAFTDAMDMIAIVEDDDRLAPCVLDQFFGYSVATVPERYNKKARKDVLTAWSDLGLGFQDMLVSIVTSPSFQYRRISTSQ